MSANHHPKFWPDDDEWLARDDAKEVLHNMVIKLVGSLFYPPNVIPYEEPFPERLPRIQYIQPVMESKTGWRFKDRHPRYRVQHEDIASSSPKPRKKLIEAAKACGSTLRYRYIELCLAFREWMAANFEKIDDLDEDDWQKFYSEVDMEDIETLQYLIDAWHERKEARFREEMAVIVAATNEGRDGSSDGIHGDQRALTADVSSSNRDSNGYLVFKSHTGNPEVLSMFKHGNVSKEYMLAYPELTMHHRGRGRYAFGPVARGAPPSRKTRAGTRQYGLFDMLGRALGTVDQPVEKIAPSYQQAIERGTDEKEGRLSDDDS